MRPSIITATSLGEAQRLLLVVRDEDGGDADRRGSAASPRRARAARIEGSRFENGSSRRMSCRLGRERAGEGDALLLAARELVGHARLVGLRGRPASAARHALRLSAPLGRPKATLAPTFMCGKSAKSWKTIATRRFSGGSERAGDAEHAAGELNLARRRGLEAGDQAQQRRLAAAARAEQRQRAGAVARRSRSAPSTAATSAEALHHAAAGQEGVAHVRSCSRRSMSSTATPRPPPASAPAAPLA